MPTDVSLQSMFSYSKAVVIIAAALFLAFAIFCLVLLILKKKKQKEEAKLRIEEPAEFVLEKLKSKYVVMLSRLADKYASEHRENRKGYEELSRMVRHFVYEATSIKVQYYTLEDIKSLNKPSLTELISTCYPPEFGPEGFGPLLGTIENAKKVINEWN